MKALSKYYLTLPSANAVAQMFSCFVARPHIVYVGSLRLCLFEKLIINLKSL